MLERTARCPDVNELAAFPKDAGLAVFKWSERIEPIDALPLTKVGKRDKVALRKMIAKTIAAEDAAQASRLSSCEVKRPKINVLGGDPSGLHFAYLTKLESTDAESFAKLQSITKSLENQEIIPDGAPVSIKGQACGSAVKWLELLRMLQGICAGVGVNILHNVDVSDTSDAG